MCQILCFKKKCLLVFIHKLSSIFNLIYTQLNKMSNIYNNSIEKSMSWKFKFIAGFLITVVVFIQLFATIRLKNTHII